MLHPGKSGAGGLPPGGALTYAYRIPATGRARTRCWGSRPTGWLRLTTMGSMVTAPPAAASTATPGALRNAPSGFYLDIIAYDNAGNWKMRRRLGLHHPAVHRHPRRAAGDEYAHGQKFMYGERGNFQYEMRYFPTWFPVEALPGTQRGWPV